MKQTQLSNRNVTRSGLGRSRAKAGIAPVPDGNIATTADPWLSRASRRGGKKHGSERSRHCVRISLYTGGLRPLALECDCKVAVNCAVCRGKESIRKTGKKQAETIGRMLDGPDRTIIILND